MSSGSRCGGGSERGRAKGSRLKKEGSIAAAASRRPFHHPSPIAAVFRDFVAAPHVLASVDAPLGPAGDCPGRGRREAGQGEAHLKTGSFFFVSLFFVQRRFDSILLACICFRRGSSWGGVPLLRQEPFVLFARLFLKMQHPVVVATRGGIASSSSFGAPRRAVAAAAAPQQQQRAPLPPPSAASHFRRLSVGSPPPASRSVAASAKPKKSAAQRAAEAALSAMEVSEKDITRG